MPRPVMLCLMEGLLALTIPRAATAQREPFPLPMLNKKSGISLSLSGANGRDWAVEHTCHDDSIADQIIYLKSHVELSLAHNERNTLMMYLRDVERVLGVNGPDGKPDSGDEGVIHYKIDRDMQSHLYAGRVPEWAPPYSMPLRFDRLTYDGNKPVLGSVGENGEPWGSSPMRSTKRFAYGQRDASGNEWHTLTYWDDDLPVYQKLGKNPHRQGASDGHCLAICVNPGTPVIQLSATGQDQFYTTPAKTYHVPRIWPQTTYLTGGVKIAFVNLTDDRSVMYRVGAGEFRPFDGPPLRAGDLIGAANTPVALEVRCGPDSVPLQRTLVLDPEYPASDEKHGFLLWADEEERQAMRHRLQNIEPFRKSYGVFRGGYYQGANSLPTDTREGWRATASQASSALANAFVVAVEGPQKAAAEARMAKLRLLMMARLQPVGFETTVSNPTPSKDFLNELGQTLQRFADAGIAYDMLAGSFRRTDHPDGMTPIEEILIRDGLAKIAKSILQFRANYSAISGSGDSHWPHGYELALGCIALAMPTYKTPYYGVSGGDREIANDLKGSDGYFWNPFPDQGVTWYGAATDANMPAPGHPNVKATFRAEFIYGDDGYWTGPNDLVGDGTRYVSGPRGNRLVDIKHGGLANAECRVELVEMHGYEVPFVARTHVFDLMKRIAGDENRPACITRYIERRLGGGIIRLAWDADAGVYRQRPSISGLTAFNRHYGVASSPAPRERLSRWLNEVKAYYGMGGQLDPGRRKSIADNERKWLYGTYTLALCETPDALPAWQPGENHAPILKPMFKYVVRPGTRISKDIIALDLDGDDLDITVEDRPHGAVFEPDACRILWGPRGTDVGVYLLNVTVSDGQSSTSRPFPIIVKGELGKGPVPPAPTGLRATVVEDGQAVELRWQPPAGDVHVAAYVIYRDGALWAATDARTLRFMDRSFIEPGSRTRYHVACYSLIGAESASVAAEPSIVDIPEVLQAQQ